MPLKSPFIILVIVVFAGALSLPCDDSQFCPFMQHALNDVGCGCIFEEKFTLSPGNTSHTIPSNFSPPIEFSFVTNSGDYNCYFRVSWGADFEYLVFGSATNNAGAPQIY